MPRKPRATSRRALSVGASIPVALPPRRPEKPTGINPRTTVEYLVVWQREGLEPKSKRFSNKKRAYDRVGVMTSDEPWKYFGSAADRKRSGDEYFCHSEEGVSHLGGCNCEGRTLREDAIYRREHLPRLLWIRVERRVVTRTAWEPYETVIAEPGESIQGESPEYIIIDDPSNTYVTPEQAQAYVDTVMSHSALCDCEECGGYSPF